MTIALVIGGTGSLGKILVPKLLEEYSQVRVLSRDEHKQIQMQSEIKSGNVDYFIGDIRDHNRLYYAIKGVDVVFHLAAIKSVDKAEYNPNEAVSINITGTQNIIDQCIKHDVPKAIFTSTDKAVEPLNIYGSSKMTAEKLWILSNAYVGHGRTKFSAVRYGNVIGSNSSVIDKWSKGENKLTNPDMTRFWITINEAAEFVLLASRSMHRGEVFIPKMKSSTMMDLANAYGITPTITGIRVGEKMHETLIGKHESSYATDVGGYYILWPTQPSYPILKRGSVLENEFTSLNANRFTQLELKEMLCTLQ